MMEEILAILLAVAIAAAIYYLMKKSLTLVINAIAGLITLWILNYFCALGGLPGALIVVLLHLFGITL